MTKRKVEDKFERTWLAKLSYSLNEIAGEEIRRAIMQGSEHLPASSDLQERVNWTIHAMEKLDNLVTEEDRKDILNNCACFYHPQWRLAEFQAKFKELNDLDALHLWMQQQFQTRMKKRLKEMNASEKFIQKVETECWGEVGRKEENVIYHTKMPANLKGYLEATDEQEKKYYYCHCPRIRAVLKSQDMKLSSSYCYCGGGFYSSLWEGILGNPVKVDLIKSVLKGDKVCSFAIHLLSGSNLLEHTSTI